MEVTDAAESDGGVSPRPHDSEDAEPSPDHTPPSSAVDTASVNTQETSTPSSSSVHPSPTPVTSSQIFLEDILSVINREDINQIQFLQSETSSNIVRANQQLLLLNDFSEKEMKRLKRDFNTNTKVLKEMRSDLNVVFTKIRAMKTMLANRYPEYQETELDFEPESS